jgi:hypothetical protein
MKKTEGRKSRATVPLKKKLNRWLNESLQSVQSARLNFLIHFLTFFDTVSLSKELSART